jgi:hypothetical protein
MLNNFNMRPFHSTQVVFFVVSGLKPRKEFEITLYISKNRLIGY